MPKQITKKQTNTLRSLAAQYLPGGDDNYRSFLLESFPKKDWKDRSRPSTLELTSGQAHGLIKKLMQVKRALKSSGDSGPSGSSSMRPSAPVPSDVFRPWAGRYEASGELTQKQADELARLEDEMGWENPERLEGFIKRQTGLDLEPGQLTKAQATSTITGLRRLASSFA